MKAIILAKLKELFGWGRVVVMDIFRMTLKFLMQRNGGIEVAEEDSTSVFPGEWCRA